MDNSLEKFEPAFGLAAYSDEEKRLLNPFFTNLEKSVYVPLLFAPELIGALCSRTSRAAEDLRTIYLKEYVTPFLNPTRESKETDETWDEKVAYGKALSEFIDFLQKHSIVDLFANPRARSFYIKWLAQYGDDSIAQMAGSHLVFCGLSQVAIKHFEDQRIGLAPIEKSTRYVNYSQKVNGQYLYYVDPTFETLGLLQEYRNAMDGLFETYTRLLPKLTDWLTKQFPDEKSSVIEKKAFDTLRGLLPVSTLSQVAFFGNGQAFEYMISRSGRHPLGEIRWAAERAYEELNHITPSFLRRVKDEDKKELVEAYQEYLAGKGRRVAPFVQKISSEDSSISAPSARLIEYDPQGEDKIITGMLYSAENAHQSWDQLFAAVQKMSTEEKRAVLEQYLAGRGGRWQKVGRAFENAYVRFEIVMNIGAWRDLQRHRMLTQQRQTLSCRHGYDIPPEIIDSGLEQEFRSAIEPVESLFARVAEKDLNLAQYVVTMAHRIRFMQWQNLREAFWEIELRSIPEGHPDYRRIEQEKFRLLEKVYPLITERMMVNMGEYDFARRGQEEKIQEKLRKLES